LRGDGVPAVCCWVAFRAALDVGRGLGLGVVLGIEVGAVVGLVSAPRG
jgi:hypothetical protein